MKSIPEALASMLPAFAALPAVREGLASARGSFLAQDVVARRDLPPFDNSAMDGYAVRFADAERASSERPSMLLVDGENRAGANAGEDLSPGNARRIFTGAPLPKGADTIVMQENTRRDGERVLVSSAPRRGEHVRRRGEDVRAGAVLLSGGTKIGAGEIALLASQGIMNVLVHRRPRVAIVSTGNELQEAWETPEPGRIVDTNAYALSAQVEEAGGIPWVLPPVPDDVDAIVSRLEDAASADVILTTGGVSVGDYDLAHDAFRCLGIATTFVKVAIKPGKPLTFGRFGRIPVVGLPGNPVSAMVTFHVFVRPGLRRMLGDPRPHPRGLRVELGEPYAHRPGRTEFVRAVLEDAGTRTIAHLHARQGSGALPSMAGIDALVVIPRETGDVPAGSTLLALSFGEPSGAEVSPLLGSDLDGAGGSG